MRKLLFLLILVISADLALQACDMSAIIMNRDKVFSDLCNLPTDPYFEDFNSPQDYLAYVMSRSTAGLNSDGYGILYYPKNQMLLRPENYWYKYIHSLSEHGYIWYTGNYFNHAYENDVFDNALQKIVQPGNHASIIMCHARFATSNPFAPGNHPFRMDINGRTYSFMHNGYVSSAVRTYMINEIYAQDPLWFDNHGPNFSAFTNSAIPAFWIDSEVLFHFLMHQIIEQDYNVLDGLRIALQKLNVNLQLSTDVVNFVFSDGQKLYAFRSTPVSGGNSGHKLSFKYDARGFFGVRTGVPTAGETELQQYELVVFSDNGTATHYPDVLSVPVQPLNRPGEQYHVFHSRSIGTATHPTQPGISISFQLEEPANVKINVYNLKGQLVRKLKNGYLPKGSYLVRWDGNNQSGRKAGRGVYYIELVKGNQRNLEKVIYTQ